MPQKFQEESSDLETQLFGLGFLCEDPDDVGSASASFSYNAHGSMTSMPHLSAMDWDFAEKLCHITSGTTEAYYSYDGSGIRTRKVVEKNGTVETRLYLGGFEIWRKTVNGTLETERETLHVMDDQRRIALVETLTVENGNAVSSPVPVLRYQLDNHLGSASLELDDSANIISYEEYYPYGDTSYRAGRNASEVSRKRYRYTGKEKDEESSLYYHGARYYACWLGRWTAVDPIGIGDGLNVYMYVHGNPVKLQDPSGGASTNSVDEGTVLPTFDDVEVIDEGDVLPTFEDIEVKGEGTYLPGDETDRLTENSTFEERQAFANRRGYKIVDPNPEEQWWVGDSENGYWHTSEQGKLVPLQDELPDSNKVILDNIENVSEHGTKDGIGFSTYADISSKVMQVALATGEPVYVNVAKSIEKLKVSALENPGLDQKTAKNVQQAFLEHLNAAKATAKFMSRANIYLSVGLGAIDVAEYAYQGKSSHALWNGFVATSAILAGLLLATNPPTVAGAILLSLGITIVASIISSIGNKILDSME